MPGKDPATFQVQRDAEAARRAERLTNIYHRGQDLSWRGQEVLAELFKKHGGVEDCRAARRLAGRAAAEAGGNVAGP